MSNTGNEQLQFEINPQNVFTIFFAGMLLSSLIPSAAQAADGDVVGGDVEVPDSRLSPRGTFVYGLTAQEVNLTESIDQEVGPRVDHLWTDIYGSRNGVLDKIGIAKSSLVIPNNEAHVIPDAESRVLDQLNTTYRNSSQAERLSLVENASNYFSYRSYLADFGSLRNIHPENYQTYQANQLNTVMYRAISHSEVFMDPNFGQNE